MGVEKKQETLGFQAEVQQLLDLMIHALYQDREIFLRELISNAADALERLRFAVLKDDALLEDDPDLKIRVEYNRQNRTISVLDNGIGMSRDDIIEQLGTIAKSGTKTFLDRLKSDQTKDSRMIGQFGVGFYASFGVANKVEVISRLAGLPRTEGVRWLSEGTNNYTVESIDRPRRGSKIVLYLRDDADEFLDGFRLRQIIKKYSDHIAVPIIMPREALPDAGEADKKSEVVAADETVNTATALWTRNKKDIKDEEYDEFYKHIAHDFEAPLTRLHVRVEGRLEYSSLAFIPKRAPFDLWDQKRRGGIKLYVRRVFITDEAEYLLPAYLRFIRGVVDADDLPLNISRETLQKNKTIDAIRSGLTKKILNKLTAMAKDDAEKYATFWEAFGRVLKEGVIEKSEHEETLLGLLRFASTHEDGAQQSVSLADYVARMGDDQKAIYYVIADNFATAKNSPHLEKLRKDGTEVLLLSDPIIDEWLTNRLDTFKDHPLRSVAKGEFAKKADDAGEDDSQTKSLLEKIKTVLEAKAKDVRASERLTESAACLVADEQELGRNLERILKASGQTVPDQKPTLEINLAHPLVKKIAAAEGDQFDDWSHILFDQALLSEGGDLDDPATFVHRLNRLFATL